MATLADINTTLQLQNKKLDTTSQGVQALSKSLVGYIRKIEGKRGDVLESEREGRSGILSAAAGGVSSGVQKVRDAAGGFKLPSIGNIGRLLAPAALAGLALRFGKRLLRRGLMGGLVTLFADEIANFIIGPEGDKQLRESLTRGLTFAGLGSIFGARFALLAGLFGFFVEDPEEIWTELKGIVSPESLDKFRKFMQENIIEGLRGIKKLFEGDILGVFKEGLVLETLTTIGLLGTAIATLFPVGGIFKIAGLGLWFGKKIIKTLFDLGKLGLAISGTAIPDFIPQNQLLDKNGKPLKGAALEARRNKIISQRPGTLTRLAKGGGSLFRIGAGGAMFLASGVSLPFLAAGATIIGAGLLAKLAYDAAKDNNIIGGLISRGQDMPGDDPAKLEENKKIRTAIAMGGFSGLTPDLKLFDDTLKALQNKSSLSKGEQDELNRMLDQKTRYRRVLSGNLENLQLYSGYDRESMREAMREQNFNSINNGDYSITNIQNESVIAGSLSNPNDQAAVGMGTNS